jgi:hypothetical protein
MITITTQDDKGAPTKKGAAAILVLLVVVGVVVLTSSTELGTTTMNDIWLKNVMKNPKNQSSMENLNVSSHIAAVVSKFSTNETCFTPEMVGAWTYVDTPNFTNAQCCSPKDEYPRDHPFCDSNEIDDILRGDRDGVNFQGNAAHLPWMQGQGCGQLCRQWFRDHYVWMSPNLLPWDAKEFCRLLGPHRRIIMLGDSTMGQASATLIAAVHGFCQTQLFYFLADTLIKEPYGLNRGSHWLDIVGNQSRTADGDIVVLTVGAHLLSWHDMINVSNVVLQQIMSMKKERPSLTFVYKTQQPGGCTNEIANVSLSPLEVGKNFVSISRKNFNHPLFYEYDNAVIRRLQGLEIPFLDMRMLYSRTDAHRSSQANVKHCRRASNCDCLHFCSPGPLDMFAILLLQLLRNNFAVSQCV